MERKLLKRAWRADCAANGYEPFRAWVRYQVGLRAVSFNRARASAWLQRKRKEG